MTEIQNMEKTINDRLNRAMTGRRTVMLIIFFGLSLIITVTLHPYNFYFKETYSNLGRLFQMMEWGESSILDVFGNIILFSPLGFGLTGYLAHVKKMAGVTSLITVIMISVGLSYIIEVIQMFQPSRFSSLIDILSNGAGGILGFLLFFLLCFIFRAADYNSAIKAKTIQLIFLGYAAFTILFSISIQHFSSFSNWNETFHLLLGNEQTGDRPWRGYISEVYIADRAISKTYAAQILSKKKKVESIGKSLLAFYRLGSMGNYSDKVGHLPDLVWRGEYKGVRQDKGVFLDTRYWLETKAPAKYLIQRIINTSQFTLGVTVATSDIIQSGPARIISLSRDPGHRNFTLGQQGSDLEFRLRTPLTGENGGEPRLTAPDVFSNTNPHNLIVTYDGSTLTLYIDEVYNSHDLELNPGAIIFGSFAHLNKYNTIVYKVIYYAIIFVPLGTLMAHAVNVMRMKFVIKTLIICGGIMLSSFILEGILVSVSGRDLRLGNLMIGVIFMAGPIVFLRYIRPSS